MLEASHGGLTATTITFSARLRYILVFVDYTNSFSSADEAMPCM